MLSEAVVRVVQLGDINSRSAKVFDVASSSSQIGTEEDPVQPSMGGCGNPQGGTVTKHKALVLTSDFKENPIN